MGAASDSGPPGWPRRSNWTHTSLSQAGHRCA
jgi:hypothetical protein